MYLLIRSNEYMLLRRELAAPRMICTRYTRGRLTIKYISINSRLVAPSKRPAQAVYLFLGVADSLIHSVLRGFPLSIPGNRQYFYSVILLQNAKHKRDFLMKKSRFYNIFRLIFTFYTFYNRYGDYSMNETPSKNEITSVITRETTFIFLFLFYWVLFFNSFTTRSTPSLWALCREMHCHGRRFLRMAINLLVNFFTGSTAGAVIVSPVRSVTAKR